MADITLTTTAVIPSGTTITITLYEDTNGDGTADNSDTQAIANGTNDYTLTGFANTAGAWYSFKTDKTSSDPTLVAQLQALTANQVDGSIPTLSAATAINITDTTATPRVTVTF